MSVFQSKMNVFSVCGESLEVVDEAVDREMTRSHWHVYVKENMGNGADRKTVLQKCYTC